MKKTLKIIGINVIILAILVSGGWWYFSKQASHNLSIARFAQTHGGATMTRFMNPKELYFATWETDTAIGMSLYVDGIWVVIGSQDKPQNETKPNE